MVEETAFTARMRRICDQAAERCPGYHPTRFRQMIEASKGDFLPKAKQMLRSGVIQRGLWTLARHNALDISMEAVVFETPWRQEFSAEDLQAAQWRLERARRMVEAGESPESEEC